MSYKIKLDQSLRRNFVRISSEQLDRAMDELNEENINQHDGIHQARKRFKKVRSLLRLYRPVLCGEYAENNAALRTAGHALSELRDLQAMIETCDDLHQRFTRQVKTLVFDAVKKKCIAQLEQKQQEDTPAAWAQEVKKILQQVRTNLLDVSIEHDDFSALCKGLKRQYERGKTAFALVCEAPSAQHYHTWRKRIKDYWYHMRLLQSLWPTVLKGFRTSSHALSSILGDEHDLSVVHEYICNEPEFLPAPTDRKVFADLVKLRQSELRTAAHPLGLCLYAEKPKQVARRFDSYLQSKKSRLELSKNAEII